MVLQALKEEGKRLTLALAKTRREKATADQQISVSAWQLHRRTEQKKKARKKAMEKPG